MNFTNDLSSMSTLAHELGHSMHSYYAAQTSAAYVRVVRHLLGRSRVQLQPGAGAGALVREEHRSATSKSRCIEEAMGNFHRYFFIMPALARFELAIHERAEQGQPLTADVMSGLLADLFAEGYGDEVEMDRERVGITWAQFPTHLYMNFYVYQYATGISGAHALAKRVLDGEPGAAEAYLEFLKAGGSAYPLDILKKAGVDLSSPEPVEETFAVLAGLVDRLESWSATKPRRTDHSTTLLPYKKAGRSREDAGSTCTFFAHNPREKCCFSIKKREFYPELEPLLPIPKTQLDFQ